MNKKIIVAVLMFVLMQTLLANPFTQKDDSPTPVQRSQGSEKIVNGMRFLSDNLAQTLESWKEEKSFRLVAIALLVSFAYGFLHALAPGHRKIVVFTHFLNRQAQSYEPAILGLCLALLHALSSLLLLFIFKGVSGAISVSTNNASIYMEGITFIILIILSLYEIIEAVILLCRKKQSDQKNVTVSAILLSALYPCPAALLILVFALQLDVIVLGVLSLITLSLGMSIPIIISGYLAWFGRKTLFTRLEQKHRQLKVIAAVLQIITFSFLFFISFRMAFPFIYWLFFGKNR